MITVIGSANMDLIASVPALPQAGETVLASELRVLPGGKGANQAVAAARAGSETVFVGRVGRDGHGDSLLASLHEAGVRTDFVVREESEPTGTALIAVDARGENMIVVASGANRRVGPGDVDRAIDVIQASRVVVLQLEVPLETVEYAARIGREAGATVILNPAPARPLPPTLLKTVDILAPNEEEVARLSGIGSPVDPASAARMLVQAGVRTVVVTLGARGATIVTPKGTEEAPTFAVDAVDTTGAGDAFVGNLARAIDHGESLAAATRFANAAAACSVRRPGAQPSMPTYDETNALLGGATR